MEFSTAAAMDYAPDTEAHKRKRTSDDTGTQPNILPPIQQHRLQALPLAQQQGEFSLFICTIHFAMGTLLTYLLVVPESSGIVNYLSHPIPERLSLLPAEPDAFADLVGSLIEYEGSSAHISIP